MLYPQGSLLSYLFFWLLQTSWQPELSKHLCYTGGILIWGLVQQKTSKMETELTICSFAASSGYKKWVSKTSSLARDRTISASLTCKCAAKGVGNKEQRFSRHDWRCWALTHSFLTFLTQNHLFPNNRFCPSEKSEHWILLKILKSWGNYINWKRNDYSIGFFFHKYLCSKYDAN